MATLALEIHDAGLVALRAGEDALAAAPSPGFALLDGERLRLGEAARSGARRLPRHVNHRFWRDLDLAPLGRPFPRRWRAADLAHAHLGAVWEEVRAGIDEVVLAVPGPFDERRLGLLLGIAHALEMPVHGLVDSALAATAATLDGEAGRFLHLDLHLHRAVLAEVVRGRRDLVRQRVAVDDGVGLVALRDAWARRAAEVFVRSTRWDPLHAAAVEQELYDRAPAWLTTLAERPAVAATLVADGREHTVELRRDDARAVTAPFRERLLALLRPLGDGGGSVLLVGHHLAAVPILAAGLEEVLGGTAIELPAEAAVRGALAARAGIVGEGSGADDSVVFVVRLPTLVGAAAAGPGGS